MYADGEHLRTDILTSLGILIGLIVIKITGIHILDPIIAIIFALIILKTGFSISKNTLNNLLDGSLPENELKKIEDIISATENVRGYKDLRARRSGPDRKIEITLIFPENMLLIDCHNICDEIEDKIKSELQNCTISIHAEPVCAACSDSHNIPSPLE